MQARIHYEEILRTEFEKKGGILKRKSPHYMVVEHSPWLSTWFENSAFIKIPIEEFDLRTISFTYGDSHPTFSDRINDGKEYRKKLYTYEEILGIIDKYGLPQDWNDDGRYGQVVFAGLSLMEMFPINYEAAAEEMKPCLAIRTNDKINAANAEVEKLAQKHHQRYIDVNNALKDEQGRLKAEYTIEGMHIKEEGYRAIYNDVMKYVKE